MPRSIWNGVITFGMVTMPVKLYTATESKDIAFHQLHKECDTRIKYQKWCPHCERTIDNDDIEKGYEYARGHYVVLTDEDFENLPLPSKHAILVTSFSKIEQIDPIYFEKSYYVEPDEQSLRAFTLFMQALSEMEMVAISTITLRNKERLCALRVYNGTLVMDTLLYPDEIRVGKETATPELKVSEKEVKMAEHLIELMQQDFNPTLYKDHYREAMRKLIDAKLEGKEIVEVPFPAARAKVVDLMDALRASVEDLKDKSEHKTKRETTSTSKRQTHKPATRTKTAKGTGMSSTRKRMKSA
jgi:DNA end-binding protein Ku